MRTLSGIRLRAVTGVLALLLLTAAGDPRRSEREILALQDQRSLGAGKLVSYLTSSDSRIVVLAARALANLQDTSTVPSLVPLMRHPSPDVRAMAVYAIGQIGCASGMEAVHEGLRRETHSAVLRRALEAAGKIGDRALLDTVASIRPNDDHPADIREQLLAMARFALRGITSERAAHLAFQRAFHQNPEVRWSALYALWRMSPSRTVDSLIKHRSVELQKLFADRQIEVRCQAATLLGKSRSREAFRLLQQWSEREIPRGNWRVGVQMARSALAWLEHEPGASALLERSLRWAHPHVRLAVLSGLSAATPSAVARAAARKSLVAVVDSLAAAPRQSDAVRGEALVALARMSRSSDRFEHLAVGEHQSLLRSKLLEALSYLPSARHLAIVMQHLDDEQVGVATAAWGCLPRLLTPSSIDAMTDTNGLLETLPTDLLRAIRRALLREDLAITATVASSVRDSSVADLLRSARLLEDVVESLMLTYTQLSSPNDVEAMQELLRTLGVVGDSRCVPVLERALGDGDRTVVAEAERAYERLTGRRVTAAARPARRVSVDAYDWKTLDGIGARARAVVSTNRGTFSFFLLKHHAPFTVLHFVKLARSGFYNGLLFHRVVPNFVVQGGDPRGDGWGSSGTAIRTEVSTVNFRRGSVGMASAGKDTEGSQFFVTVSPQPHLDGRYTVFGEVDSGLEVVDALQIGDRILRIRIVE